MSYLRIRLLRVEGTMRKLWREKLCISRRSFTSTNTRIMEFKGISFWLSTHTLIFCLKNTLKIPLIFYQWVLKYPYFSRNNYKIGYFSANLGHFSPFVVKTVKKYPYATQFWVLITLILVTILSTRLKYPYWPYP